MSTQLTVKLKGLLGRDAKAHNKKTVQILTSGCVQFSENSGPFLEGAGGHFFFMEITDTGVANQNCNRLFCWLAVAQRKVRRAAPVRICFAVLEWGCVTVRDVDQIKKYGRTEAIVPCRWRPSRLLEEWRDGTLMNSSGGTPHNQLRTGTAGLAPGCV